MPVSDIVKQEEKDQPQEDVPVSDSVKQEEKLLEEGKPQEDVPVFVSVKQEEKPLTEDKPQYVVSVLDSVKQEEKLLEEGMPQEDVPVFVSVKQEGKHLTEDKPQDIVKQEEKLVEDKPQEDMPVSDIVKQEEKDQPQEDIPVSDSVKQQEKDQPEEDVPVSDSVKQEEKDKPQEDMHVSDSVKQEEKDQPQKDVPVSDSVKQVRPSKDVPVLDSVKQEEKPVPQDQPQDIPVSASVKPVAESESMEQEKHVSKVKAQEANQEILCDARFESEVEMWERSETRNNQTDVELIYKPQKELSGTKREQKEEVPSIDQQESYRYVPERQEESKIINEGASDVERLDTVDRYQEFVGDGHQLETCYEDQLPKEDYLVSEHEIEKIEQTLCTTSWEEQEDNAVDDNKKEERFDDYLMKKLSEVPFSEDILQSDDFDLAMVESKVADHVWPTTDSHLHDIRLMEELGEKTSAGDSILPESDRAIEADIILPDSDRAIGGELVKCAVMLSTDNMTEIQALTEDGGQPVARKRRHRKRKHRRSQAMVPNEPWSSSSSDPWSSSSSAESALDSGESYMKTSPDGVSLDDAVPLFETNPLSPVVINGEITASCHMSQTCPKMYLDDKFENRDRKKITEPIHDAGSTEKKTVIEEIREQELVTEPKPDLLECLMQEEHQLVYYYAALQALKNILTGVIRQTPDADPRQELVASTSGPQVVAESDQIIPQNTQRSAYDLQSKDQVCASTCTSGLADFITEDIPISVDHHTALTSSDTSSYGNPVTNRQSVIMQAVPTSVVASVQPTTDRESQNEDLMLRRKEETKFGQLEVTTTVTEKSGDRLNSSCTDASTPCLLHDIPTSAYHYTAIQSYQSYSDYQLLADRQPAQITTKSSLPDPEENTVTASEHLVRTSLQGIEAAVEASQQRSHIIIDIPSAVEHYNALSTLDDVCSGINVTVERVLRVHGGYRSKDKRVSFADDIGKFHPRTDIFSIREPFVERKEIFISVTSPTMTITELPWNVTAGSDVSNSLNICQDNAEVDAQTFVKHEPPRHPSDDIPCCCVYYNSLLIMEDLPVVINGEQHVAENSIKVDRTDDHPLAELARDDDHPVTELAQDDDHPVTELARDDDHPVTELTGDDDHPVTELAGDNDHPVTELSRNDYHPVTELGQDDDHPVTELARDLQLVTEVSRDDCDDDDDVQPVTELAGDDVQPVTELSRDDDHPVTELARDDDHPVTELSRNDDHPVTELGQDDDHPVTELARDLQLVTEVSRDDCDDDDDVQPVTELAGDDVQPVTELSRDDDHPVTELARYDDHPVTELTRDDYQPVTELTGDDDQPVTELARDDYHPVTELGQDDDHPVTELARDLQLVTEVSRDDCDDDDDVQPVTELAGDDVQPVTELSRNDDHPVTELGQDDDHPVTELARDLQLVTEVSRDDCDDDDDVQPVTELAGDDVQPVTELSRDDDHPVTELARDDDHPVTELTRDDNQPVTELTGDDDQPVTELARDDDHPVTELARDDDHPVTELTRDDYQPVTELARDDDQPVTELARDGDHPVTELSRNDDHPVTELGQDDDHPVTELARDLQDDDHPVTELARDDDHPVTELTRDDYQPVTELARDDDQPVTELARDGDHPVTELSRNDDHPVTELGQDDDHPVTELARDLQLVTEVSRDDYDDDDVQPVTELAGDDVQPVTELSRDDGDQPVTLLSRDDDDQPVTKLFRDEIQLLPEMSRCESHQIPKIFSCDDQPVYEMSKIDKIFSSDDKPLTKMFSDEDQLVTTVFKDDNHLANEAHETEANENESEKMHNQYSVDKYILLRHDIPLSCVHFAGLDLINRGQERIALSVEDQAKFVEHSDVQGNDVPLSRSTEDHVSVLHHDIPTSCQHYNSVSALSDVQTCIIAMEVTSSVSDSNAVASETDVIPRETDFKESHCQIQQENTDVYVVNDSTETLLVTKLSKPSDDQEQPTIIGQMLDKKEAENHTREELDLVQEQKALSSNKSGDVWRGSKVMHHSMNDIPACCRYYTSLSLLEDGSTKAGMLVRAGSETTELLICKTEMHIQPDDTVSGTNVQEQSVQETMVTVSPNPELSEHLQHLSHSELGIAESLDHRPPNVDLWKTQENIIESEMRSSVMDQTARISSYADVDPENRFLLSHTESFTDHQEPDQDHISVFVTEPEVDIQQDSDDEHDVTCKESKPGKETLNIDFDEYLIISSDDEAYVIRETTKKAVPVIAKVKTNKLIRNSDSALTNISVEQTTEPTDEQTDEHIITEPKHRQDSVTSENHISNEHTMSAKHNNVEIEKEDTISMEMPKYADSANDEQIDESDNLMEKNVTAVPHHITDQDQIYLEFDRETSHRTGDILPTADLESSIRSGQDLVNLDPLSNVQKKDHSNDTALVNPNQHSLENRDFQMKVENIRPSEQIETVGEIRDDDDDDKLVGLQTERELPVVEDHSPIEESKFDQMRTDEDLEALGDTEDVLKHVINQLQHKTNQHTSSQDEPDVTGVRNDQTAELTPVDVTDQQKSGYGTEDENDTYIIIDLPSTTAKETDTSVSTLVSDATPAIEGALHQVQGGGSVPVEIEQLPSGYVDEDRSVVPLADEAWDSDSSTSSISSSDSSPERGISSQLEFTSGIDSDVRKSKKKQLSEKALQSRRERRRKRRLRKRRGLIGETDDVEKRQDSKSKKERKRKSKKGTVDHQEEDDQTIKELTKEPEFDTFRIVPTEVREVTCSENKTEVIKVDCSETYNTSSFQSDNQTRFGEEEHETDTEQTEPEEKDGKKKKGGVQDTAAGQGTSGQSTSGAAGGGDQSGGGSGSGGSGSGASGSGGSGESGSGAGGSASGSGSGKDDDNGDDDKKDGKRKKNLTDKGLEGLKRRRKRKRLRKRGKLVDELSKSDAESGEQKGDRIAGGDQPEKAALDELEKEILDKSPKHKAQESRVPHHARDDVEIVKGDIFSDKRKHESPVLKMKSKEVVGSFNMAESTQVSAVQDTGMLSLNASDHQQKVKTSAIDDAMSELKYSETSGIKMQFDETKVHLADYEMKHKTAPGKTELSRSTMEESQDGVPDAPDLDLDDYIIISSEEDEFAVSKEEPKLDTSERLPADKHVAKEKNVDEISKIEPTSSEQQIEEISVRHADVDELAQTAGFSEAIVAAGLRQPPDVKKSEPNLDQKIVEVSLPQADADQLEEMPAMTQEDYKSPQEYKGGMFAGKPPSSEDLKKTTSLEAEVEKLEDTIAPVTTKPTKEQLFIADRGDLQLQSEDPAIEQLGNIAMVQPSSAIVQSRTTDQRFEEVIIDSGNFAKMSAASPQIAAMISSGQLMKKKEEEKEAKALSLEEDEAQRTEQQAKDPIGVANAPSEPKIDFEESTAPKSIAVEEDEDLDEVAMMPRGWYIESNNVSITDEHLKDVTGQQMSDKNVEPKQIDTILPESTGSVAVVEGLQADVTQDAAAVVTEASSIHARVAVSEVAQTERALTETRVPDAAVGLWQDVTLAGVTQVTVTPASIAPTAGVTADDKVTATDTKAEERQTDDTEKGEETQEDENVDDVAMMPLGWDVDETDNQQIQEVTADKLSEESLLLSKAPKQTDAVLPETATSVDRVDQLQASTALIVASVPNAPSAGVPEVAQTKTVLAEFTTEPTVTKIKDEDRQTKGEEGQEDEDVDDIAMMPLGWDVDETDNQQIQEVTAEKLSEESLLLSKAPKQTDAVLPETATSVDHVDQLQASTALIVASVPNAPSTGVPEVAQTKTVLAEFTTEPTVTKIKDEDRQTKGEEGQEDEDVDDIAMMPLGWDVDETDNQQIQEVTAEKLSEESLLLSKAPKQTDAVLPETTTTLGDVYQLQAGTAQIVASVPNAPSAGVPEVAQTKTVLAEFTTEAEPIVTEIKDEDRQAKGEEDVDDVAMMPLGWDVDDSVDVYVTDHPIEDVTAKNLMDERSLLSETPQQTDAVLNETTSLVAGVDKLQTGVIQTAAPIADTTPVGIPGDEAKPEVAQNDRALAEIAVPVVPIGLLQDQTQDFVPQSTAVIVGAPVVSGLADKATPERRQDDLENQKELDEDIDEVAMIPLGWDVESSDVSVADQHVDEVIDKKSTDDNLLLDGEPKQSDLALVETRVSVTDVGLKADVSQAAESVTLASSDVLPGEVSKPVLAQTGAVVTESRLTEDVLDETEKVELKDAALVTETVTESIPTDIKKDEKSLTDKRQVGAESTTSSIDHYRSLQLLGAIEAGDVILQSVVSPESPDANTQRDGVPEKKTDVLESEESVPVMLSQADDHSLYKIEVPVSAANLESLHMLQGVKSGTVLVSTRDQASLVNKSDVSPVEDNAEPLKQPPEVVQSPLGRPDRDIVTDTENFVPLAQTPGMEVLNQLEGLPIKLTNSSMEYVKPITAEAVHEVSTESIPKDALKDAVAHEDTVHGTTLPSSRTTVESVVSVVDIDNNLQYVQGMDTLRELERGDIEPYLVIDNAKPVPAEDTIPVDSEASDQIEQKRSLPTEAYPELPEDLDGKSPVEEKLDEIKDASYLGESDQQTEYLSLDRVPSHVQYALGLQTLTSLEIGALQGSVNSPVDEKVTPDITRVSQVEVASAQIGLSPGEVPVDVSIEKEVQVTEVVTKEVPKNEVQKEKESQLDIQARERPELEQEDQVKEVPEQEIQLKEVSKQEIPEQEVQVKEIPEQDVQIMEVPKPEAQVRAVLEQEVQLKEIPEQEVEVKEIPEQEVQVKEIPEQEVQVKEIQKHDLQIKEIPEQEVEVKEIPEQEVEVKEIPEQEVQVKEIPEQEVQVKEIPEQEVEVKEIPEQEVQVKEIPEQEVQVKEVPEQEIEVKDIPVQKVQVKEVTEQEVQVKEIQEQEVQVKEIPEQEVQVKEIPEQEVQVKEVPEQEIEVKDIPVQKVQVKEVTEQEVQVKEIQEQEVQVKEVSKQAVQIKEVPEQEAHLKQIPEQEILVKEIPEKETSEETKKVSDIYQDVRTVDDRQLSESDLIPDIEPGKELPSSEISTDVITGQRASVFKSSPLGREPSVERVLQTVSLSPVVIKLNTEKGVTASSHPDNEVPSPEVTEERKEEQDINANICQISSRVKLSSINVSTERVESSVSSTSPTIVISEEMLLKVTKSHLAGDALDEHRDEVSISSGVSQGEDLGSPTTERTEEFLTTATRDILERKVEASVTSKQMAVGIIEPEVGHDRQEETEVKDVTTVQEYVSQASVDTNLVSTERVEWFLVFSERSTLVVSSGQRSSPADDSDRPHEHDNDKDKSDKNDPKPKDKETESSFFKKIFGKRQSGPLDGSTNDKTEEPNQPADNLTSISHPITQRSEVVDIDIPEEGSPVDDPEVFLAPEGDINVEESNPVQSCVKMVNDERVQMEEKLIKAVDATSQEVIEAYKQQLILGQVIKTDEADTDETHSSGSHLDSFLSSGQMSDVDRGRLVSMSGNSRIVLVKDDLEKTVVSDNTIQYITDSSVRQFPESSILQTESQISEKEETLGVCHQDRDYKGNHNIRPDDLLLATDTCLLDDSKESPDSVRTENTSSSLSSYTREFGKIHTTEDLENAIKHIEKRVSALEVEAAVITGVNEETDSSEYERQSERTLSSSTVRDYSTSPETEQLPSVKEAAALLSFEQEILEHITGKGSDIAQKGSEQDLESPLIGFNKTTSPVTHDHSASPSSTTEASTSVPFDKEKVQQFFRERSISPKQLTSPTSLSREHTPDLKNDDLPVVYHYTAVYILSDAEMGSSAEAARTLGILTGEKLKESSVQQSDKRYYLTVERKIQMEKPAGIRGELDVGVKGDGVDVGDVQVSKDLPEQGMMIEASLPCVGDVQHLKHLDAENKIKREPKTVTDSGSDQSPDTRMSSEEVIIKEQSCEQTKEPSREIESDERPAMSVRREIASLAQEIQKHFEEQKVVPGKAVADSEMTARPSTPLGEKSTDEKRETGSEVANVLCLKEDGTKHKVKKKKSRKKGKNKSGELYIPDVTDTKQSDEPTIVSTNSAVQTFATPNLTPGVIPTPPPPPPPQPPPPPPPVPGPSSFQEQIEKKKTDVPKQELKKIRSDSPLKPAFTDISEICDSIEEIMAGPSPEKKRQRSRSRSAKRAAAKARLEGRFLRKVSSDSNIEDCLEEDPGETVIVLPGKPKADDNLLEWETRGSNQSMAPVPPTDERSDNRKMESSIDGSPSIEDHLAKSESEDHVDQCSSQTLTPDVTSEPSARNNIVPDRLSDECTDQVGVVSDEQLPSDSILPSTVDTDANKYSELCIDTDEADPSLMYRMGVEGGSLLMTGGSSIMDTLPIGDVVIETIVEIETVMEYLLEKVQDHSEARLLDVPDDPVVDQEAKVPALKEPALSDAKPHDKLGKLTQSWQPMLSGISTISSQDKLLSAGVAPMLSGIKTSTQQVDLQADKEQFMSSSVDRNSLDLGEFLILRTGLGEEDSDRVQSIVEPDNFQKTDMETLAKEKLKMLLEDSQNELSYHSDSREILKALELGEIVMPTIISVTGLSTSLSCFDTPTEKAQRDHTPERLDKEDYEVDSILKVTIEQSEDKDLKLEVCIESLAVDVAVQEGCHSGMEDLLAERNTSDKCEQEVKQTTVDSVDDVDRVSPEDDATVSAPSAQEISQPMNTSKRGQPGRLGGVFYPQWMRSGQRYEVPQTQDYKQRSPKDQSPKPGFQSYGPQIRLDEIDYDPDPRGSQSKVSPPIQLEVLRSIVSRKRIHDLLADEDLEHNEKEESESLIRKDHPQRDTDISGGILDPSRIVGVDPTVAGTQSRKRLHSEDDDMERRIETTKNDSPKESNGRRRPSPVVELISSIKIPIRKDTDTYHKEDERPMTNQEITREVAHQQQLDNKPDSCVFIAHHETRGRDDPQVGPPVQPPQHLELDCIEFDALNTSAPDLSPTLVSSVRGNIEASDDGNKSEGTHKRIDQARIKDTSDEQNREHLQADNAIVDQDTVMGLAEQTQSSSSSHDQQVMTQGPSSLQVQDSQTETKKSQKDKQTREISPVESIGSASSSSSKVVEIHQYAGLEDNIPLVYSWDGVPMESSCELLSTSEEGADVDIETMEKSFSLKVITEEMIEKTTNGNARQIEFTPKCESTKGEHLQLHPEVEHRISSKESATYLAVDSKVRVNLDENQNPELAVNLEANKNLTNSIINKKTSTNTEQATYENRSQDGITAHLITDSQPIQKIYQTDRQLEQKDAKEKRKIQEEHYSAEAREKSPPKKRASEEVVHSFLYKITTLDNSETMKVDPKEISANPGPVGDVFSAAVGLTANISKLIEAAEQDMFDEEEDMKDVITESKPTEVDHGVTGQMSSDSNGNLSDDSLDKECLTLREQAFEETTAQHNQDVSSPPSNLSQDSLGEGLDPDLDFEPWSMTFYGSARIVTESDPADCGPIFSPLREVEEMFSDDSINGKPREDAARIERDPCIKERDQLVDSVDSLDLEASIPTTKSDQLVPEVSAHSCHPAGPSSLRVPFSYKDRSAWSQPKKQRAPPIRHTVERDSLDDSENSDGGADYYVDKS
ncbi:hypothetical protein LSH36_25g07054 [Paralvinella palmiformis]|uniref:Uncharacterized protein n=1 Tax=Paralvinella palmiformis TaxID=53620 RepID=A0AAD9KC22_9ANNE|nr:hypothetical protein LSH36_25g07054 [Paralvinella palmiformis]